jgi:hypothetical protein
MDITAIISSIVSALLGLGAGLSIHFVRRTANTRDLASELRVSVAVIDTSLNEFRRSADAKLLRLEQSVAELPCNGCGPILPVRKAAGE